MKAAVLATAGLTFALSGVVLLPRAEAQQPSCEDGKLWRGHETEFEEQLRTGQVITVEDVGSGVTRPKKVVLKTGSGVLKAVFKPIKRGRQRGFWESYEAEVVAYELDKLLGLEMVPPTVERRVGDVTGSLQLWVDDCKLYEEAEASVPQTSHWSQELSRMKMFDNLICNKDRNAGNFLVSSDGTIVLIDHSRAFLTDKKIEKDEKKLPTQFDRALVTRLKELDRDDLRERFKNLLMKSQIDAIVARRDSLLEYLDQLLAERPEAAVLFGGETP